MSNEAKNRDLISEEEFNRMVVARGIQLPEDDSHGDSDTDKAIETELGERYPENDSEPLDEALDDIERNDRPEGLRRTPDADEELIQTRTTEHPAEGAEPSEAGARSSTWPDRADLDDVPMKGAI